ncbi:MAG TPA: hypothetical protein VG496_01900 [Myxococcales bacterium]|nr:hypothetical protein [Myxococcales bacterium]
MPQKSRQRREVLAKRAGTAETLKKIDVGREPPLSGHAAKKSRHVAAQVVTPDRMASPRVAPGEGRAAVPPRDASESRDHFRSEAGSGRRPGHQRKEDR